MNIEQPPRLRRYSRPPDLASYFTKQTSTTEMAPAADLLAANLAQYRQQRQAAERDLNAALDRTRNELEGKRKAVNDASRGELDTLALACRDIGLISATPGDMEKYVVANSEWIDLTLKLRSAVEHFSFSFFAGKPPPNITMPLASSVVWKETLVSEAALTTIQPYFKSYMRTIPKFDHYLLSDDRCPHLIQTFLWRVLLGEVFNHYRWAGAGRNSMVGLISALTQGINGSQSDPGTSLKIHLWKRFTSDQIFDAFSTTPKEDRDFAHLVQIQYLMDRITEVIGPFVRTEKDLDAKFNHLLYSLLEVAILFDKRICLQMAWMEWRVPSVSEGFLVTQPGLVRRGTPDGTSFEGEIVLCACKIYWDPSSRTDQGPSLQKTVRWAVETPSNAREPPVPPSRTDQGPAPRKTVRCASDIPSEDQQQPVLFPTTEGATIPTLVGLGITLREMDPVRRRPRAVFDEESPL